MNQIPAGKWAAEQAKNEAEAFEKALNRIKPNAPADELEQAFRQGYMQGRRDRDTDTRILTIALHYGYEAQREQFEEECAEAILAAQKCKRRCTNESFINLAEEVADVIIMAEQMRELISASLVDGFIQKKLERQHRRMQNEEKQREQENAKES